MKRVVAILESADELSALATGLLADGFAGLTTYSPHDLPTLPDALTPAGEPLTRCALAGGVAGMAVAFGVQWWGQVHAYPLNVGGRPLFPVPAFIPVTFEGMILGAGLAIIGGWLWQLRLPLLWHPIDEVAGFERTTADRFWLTVPIADDASRATLTEWLGAHGVTATAEFDE